MKRIAALGFLPALLFLLSSYYFDKTAPSLKATEIEKQFVEISDKILLGKYEISNGDYLRFMAHLKQTKQAELYSKCLLNTSLWTTGSSPAGMSENYHTLKAFEDHPVLTVSYDAANEYCKWITALYNADKERKFKKVVFRLPTEGEWTQAASGGNINKMYPWGNFYLRNRKGEFLCNFLRLGDQSIRYDEKTKTYIVVETFIESANQTASPTPVNGFDPSPAGLYNVSGNAAEMVAEKGLAKGGSYNDPGYNVTISSKKHYEGPSTEIGFRVLMEVIER